MSNIAANDFGADSKNLLKLQIDTARMNCHVSSVIYKIRDHGPAILDGEFYRDSSNAVLPGKAQAPPAIAPEASAAVVSNLPGRGGNRIMLFSILLLTVALIGVGFYAYQQKQYVNELQSVLKIYDDLDQQF